MATGDIDPESERWAIRQRLNLMVVIASAIERMDEINGVVRACADRPAAVRALCDPPFGFSEQEANHVLDIAVARQTVAGRQGLQVEIQQARKQLADPEMGQPSHRSRSAERHVGAPRGRARAPVLCGCSPSTRERPAIMARWASALDDRIGQV